MHRESTRCGPTHTVVPCTFTCLIRSNRLEQLGQTQRSTAHNLDSCDDPVRYTHTLGLDDLECLVELLGTRIHPQVLCDLGCTCGVRTYHHCSLQPLPNVLHLGHTLGCKVLAVVLQYFLCNSYIEILLQLAVGEGHQCTCLRIHRDTGEVLPSVVRSVQWDRQATYISRITSVPCPTQCNQQGMTQACLRWKGSLGCCE